MYARAHAYTPYCTYSIFENSLSFKSLLTKYEVKNETSKSTLIPEPNVPINITDVDNGGILFTII